MSAEAEKHPANGDGNAQAAEDAQKMLAELQAETGPETTADSTSKDVDKNIEAGAEANQESGNKANEAAETKQHRDSDRQRERGGGSRGRGSGRGRGGFNNGRPSRDNIKSDLTTQEVTDDPVAIRKQVEFYFSDSNLPMDKFLLEQVGGSKNNPVELKTIHSFKRMRRFQPFEAIAAALKDSTFLVLTDDNLFVKRREPLPEALNDGPNPDAVKLFEDKAMPRSVYVKGFGEEVPSTQFDIEAFFTPYGPTNAIRLRRTDDKIFKRSVFVEFETEELAKKFLELDPKPTFKGKDLLIMSKKEYCDKKIEDIKSGKIQPSQRPGGGRRFDKKNGKDFKRKRDNEDDRDWRERREEDRKGGFRDDRRKNNRDRDGRGRGGRDERVERDNRGVPVVKSTSKEEEKAKQNSQKASAIAKARAVVEQDNEAADDGQSKKRGREQDDQADTEREAKKQDVKADA